MEPGDWAQAVIEFADRETAERVAVDNLRPTLAAAQADRVITRGWFVRKTPCWRLRYLPATGHASQRLAYVLDGLTNDGRIIGWTAGIYEPEVHAFGGAAGMDIAHDLFHHDSRSILDYLHRQRAAAPGAPDLGRRELAILLFSVLMRAAVQDWYEQGDVWAKVAELRPAERAAPPTERLKTAVRRLMTVDASPTSALVNGGPLAPLAAWSATFERVGQQLAELARRGTLERGLRAVLAHHVIFHWNRLGLPHADQHTLSTLAKEIVMGKRDGVAAVPQTSTGGTSIDEGNTEMTDETGSTTAERLRNALSDQLRAQGTVRTERVEAALRQVPRHVFVPEAPLAEAYADAPLYTKTDGAGASISAASQPTIVAMMLEQLQAEPGQRIMELGAGTGYNAALLAHLVGEHGQVTTIDVDDDIVDSARSGLAAAGFENVRVILCDGALGHPGGAPYDRIIATVGAWGMPPAWLEQLAPGGRLVVPLRLRGSVSRSIVFERDNGRWRSTGSQICTFMPLRGIADDARRIVALTPDRAVTLQTHQEQTVDTAALTGVLEQPRTQAWTAVKFRGPESMEWMDLWLTCTVTGALSRMPVEKSAVASGLVTPQFPWGSMALADKGDLAYLTLRPVERAADGGQLYEVGVVGHGPGGDALTGRIVDAIRTWDRDYRSRPVQFEIQATDAEPVDPVPGRFAIDTPLNRIVVAWQ